MAKKKSKQTKAPKKVAKEVPVEAPKKKKKKHTGLKVFAILMTIFVVFPIAFVFIAFFDTSTKKVSAKDIHYENLVSETFYNAVTNLGDTGSLDFTINEEMFDGIMMAACDKVNQKQFIPKMYCYVNKNHYNFVVDLQASFFKTRVQLQTTLDSDGQFILVFKINKIVIGRLPIPVNWITGILTNFIKDDMLNNVFEQSGFRIKSDLAHAKLTYARKDFREDVGNYIEKLGSNNEYLKLLLDVVGDNPSDLLYTDYNNGVKASILLSALMPEEEDYQPLLKFSKVELDGHKEAITQWLDAGYLEESQVANMFSYLVRGYDESPEAVQQHNFIEELDDNFKNETIIPYLNSITKSTDTTLDNYKGSVIDYSNTQRFKDYCGDGKITITHNNPELSNPYITITLDGDSLNKYLMYNMTDAIGKTIPITFKDSDNKWGFEYIFVDNLFIKFKEIEEANKKVPQMTLYLSLNIAGYPICLELVTNDIKIDGANTTGGAEGEGTFGGINFNIKNINFGVIPLGSTELLDTLLKMIPEGGDFTYHSDNVTEHKLGYFSIGLDNFLENIKGELKTAIIGLLANKSIKYSSKVTNNTFEITYPEQS